MRPDFVTIARSFLPNYRAPALGHAEHPLDAAVAWIEKAHQAAGDGGVSKGYDTLRSKWDPSYPETTGYLVPSLLNVAKVKSRPELANLALKLADYLLRVATPEGGVIHWDDGAKTPVVFDTGQVMFGWLAAFQATGNAQYLEAARRAGLWLCAIQDGEGSWTTGQHLGVRKVIDTRVAWALLLLHGIEPNENVRTAAVRNLDWAASQQQKDGWFFCCSFTPQEDPFTHTLAYTAEGFLECAKLLGDDRYFTVGRRTAEALLYQLEPDGALCSTFAEGWRRSSRSSCLTGNCQSAELWLHLYELDPQPRYLEGAKRSLSFVARRQSLNRAFPETYGAVPGSAPFYGIYERFKFPNWSVKFYIDALLALEHAERGIEVDFYRG